MERKSQAYHTSLKIKNYQAINEWAVYDGRCRRSSRRLRGRAWKVIASKTKKVTQKVKS